MINKIIYVFFVLSFTSCSVLKPDSYMLKSSQSKASDYKKVIAAFFKKHLSVLASDEFEGRKPLKKDKS